MASLCFSDGEGLRLLPAPFSALQLTVGGLRPEAKSPPQPSLNKFVPGSAHAPVKRQERGKRWGEGGDALPAGRPCALPPSLPGGDYCARAAGWPPSPRLLPSPGRSPPHLS